MVTTITSQYKKYSYLWPGAKIKKLITVKSLYPPWLTDSHPYQNFFDYLAAMKTEVAQQEFDFAIVGAGAYSLLLLKFIKELGMPCVHLGGQTQLLFGIRENAGKLNIQKVGAKLIVITTRRCGYTHYPPMSQATKILLRMVVTGNAQF